MPRWSETIRMPNGGVAIVCGSGKRPRNRCTDCGKPATLQCDFPLMTAGTCDRYLCSGCATSIGDKKDYCRHHTTETA